jgi:hypothetical protein
VRLASLLLSAWLGAALLFAAVVAPAAFAVLPERSLAGALVGRVLPVLFTSGLVLSLAGVFLDRPGEGRYFLARRAAMLAIAVSCAVAQFVVAPRIARVRGEITGPLEQLPADDPRRAAFGRLHAVSVAWLGVAMVAAGLTIVLGSLPPRAHGRAEAESAAASVPRRV